LFLTNVNGTLYFRACEPATGCELWTTDGTTAGTTLLADVRGGPQGSSPQRLTDVNGRLFFAAFTPATGGALWTAGSLFTDTVTAGGTVTTDPGGQGATSSHPLQVAVTTPTGGTISIVLAPTTTAPSGFTLLGERAEITAPPATAADPLVFVFRLDFSAIPTGEDESTITLFKDGVPVADCTGSPGVAAPDPCIASRTSLGDGDVELTVLTSTASEWALGMPAPQIVLGKSLAVKDPAPGVDPARRSVVVVGKETASDDTVVGNPLANGATIEIIANGAGATAQTFTLPAGAAAPGVAGWKAVGTPVTGYKYTDALGAHGPVKAALLQRKADGTFLIKVTAKGLLGSITVLPPAPGSDGGMRFVIPGGATYCVAFGGDAAGLIKNTPTAGVPNKAFRVASTALVPTLAAGCPQAP
jgi:ELWxxDGT repeat protein